MVEDTRSIGGAKDDSSPADDREEGADPDAASVKLTAAQVITFLDSAPQEVRRQIVEHIGTQSAGEAPDSSAKSDVAEYESALLSDEELADLELAEEDDDVLYREKARPDSGGKPSRYRRILIVVAVAVGVGLGLWSVQPATDQATNPHPDVSQMSADDAQALVKEYEERVAKSPGDVEAHLRLGVLWLQLGERNKARQQLDMAAKLSPKKPEPWYYLGFYFMSNTPPDKKQAHAAWQKVIELAPDSDIAREVKRLLEVPAHGVKPTTPTPSSGGK